MLKLADSRPLNGTLPKSETLKPHSKCKMQKAETESLCRLAGMIDRPDPEDPTKAADWWKPETDQ